MGKNKRKYDGEPPKAQEVTKRNLSKLRKLSKPEHPLAAEIRAKAGEFLADRKNANCLVDIIGNLDLSEPTPVASAAIESIQRIVMTLIQKNQIKRPSEPSGEESTEMKYRRWLFERIDNALTKISELLFHRKSSVANLAVVTLMNIAKNQNFSLTPKDWDMESMRILTRLVHAFCSHTHSAKIPFLGFHEFFMYDDVGVYFFEKMEKIFKSTDANKASPIFVDNILDILEAYKFPDPEQFGKGSKFIGTGEVKMVNLKRNYGKIWIRFVRCNFKVNQYKRTLVMLNEKVMGILEKPVLMADFLFGCFDVGGAISVLSLNGLYTLMTKHNLDCPEFYSHLYKLFQVEIFHMKFKARFFYMANIFLASTHLQMSLVASFVKRLARLSLKAPAESLPLCIKFIYNLIHRHQSLNVLLDGSDRMDLTTDPFLPDEQEPLNTNALKSSLWEIQSLTHHIVPDVRNFAKDLYVKGVNSKGTEKDISGDLDKTYSYSFKGESRRQITPEVALNWEAPIGLKFANNDFTSKIFEFA